METRDNSRQLTHLIWGGIYGEDLVARRTWQQTREKEGKKKKEEEEDEEEERKKVDNWKKWKRIEGRDASQSPSAKRYKYANVRVWEELLLDRVKTNPHLVHFPSQERYDDSEQVKILKI